jgi:ribosomal protein S18 acetylase RimI-like enzyme
VKSGLQLRQASISDLQILLDIEEDSFVNDRISRRQMGYLLSKAKARSWLALCDGQAAGYCTLLLPAKPRPARLYSLAVMPRFRGRHIAKFLLSESTRVAKEAGYNRIRLEVSEQNMTAKKIYLEFGFRPVCDLPAYYEDGTSGIRMQYELIT